jgi:DNA-binding CsgD family transcriptional regulator/catechol 2,3-dioxygenase-like lactoylglutathione lyase family enzyme
MPQMPAAARRGRPPHADVLTPAEWRVVHAIQHGMSNREIARRRGISADAVKYHLANALAKLGLPDRRALRAWFRAPAGSALSERKNSMATSEVLGPLAQISRQVRDIKESQEWYGTTLGLRHLYSFGTLAFFDCGGTRLYLQQHAKPGAESILYLRVADIAAEHAALKSRGVVFSAAPHLVHRHADGTEEWLATFADPEGRPLMLMAQVKP